MNEKQKDKGLMKAVKEQPQFRLTSNFTFRTMQTECFSASSARDLFCGKCSTLFLQTFLQVLRPTRGSPRSRSS